MAKHNTEKLRGQLGQENYDALVAAGRLQGDGHLTWTQSSPSSWRKAERELWATRGVVHGNDGAYKEAQRAFMRQRVVNDNDPCEQD